MSDGFAEMIPRAITFFERLKANNTKAFYEEHKDFYRDEIRNPAGRAVGFPQPVMADRTAFVRIGDTACFDPCHFLQGHGCQASVAGQ
jgi:uncharacterized protein (DUF2461 family)